MSLPRSLRWRIAVVYTALIFVTMGAVSLLLIGLLAPAADAVGGAESTIGRIVVTTAATTVIVGAISIGIAFLLSRTTVQSVRTVAEGARRLAEGDLEYRVASGSTDETSGLAEAFNSMALTIRDMVRDLDAERGLLAVVMDTMADGVIVLDSQGRMRLINRVAEDLLSPGGMIEPGRPLAQMVRDPEVLQIAARAAETRRIQQAEIELLHRRRFLSVVATPTSDDEGEGVLLTLKDVTEFHQVDTTRREFVSNVSHELRSPLASVRAMVETLEGGAIGSPTVAQDFLSRIQSDVERMTSLVEELLQLSRLESGQMPIELGPVDLCEVVEPVLERFELPAAAKSVRLDADLPHGLPDVVAEAGKLDQITTNLLENALRFTPAGGSVTVSARPHNGWVELTVEDTGVGIPRQHLPHVFERFYKVDRSRSDGGTGLGLAIAKHLVQAHGGEISAESVEGEGSAFRVTLMRAT